MFRASICPSSGVLGCLRCILQHMVFSTRCCGWGSEEPVCSLVHWCKFLSDWLVGFLFHFVVLCIVVCKRALYYCYTGDNPTAVNKYVTSCHTYGGHKQPDR